MEDRNAFFCNKFWLAEHLTLITNQLFLLLLSPPKSKKLLVHLWFFLHILQHYIFKKGSESNTIHKKHFSAFTKTVFRGFDFIKGWIHFMEDWNIFFKLCLTQQTIYFRYWSAVSFIVFISGHHEPNKCCSLCLFLCIFWGITLEEVHGTGRILGKNVINLATTVLTLDLRWVWLLLDKIFGVKQEVDTFFSE